MNEGILIWVISRCFIGESEWSSPGAGPEKARCPTAEAAGHRSPAVSPAVVDRGHFIFLPADFRCWAASTIRAAIPASAALP